MAQRAAHRAGHLREIVLPGPAALPGFPDQPYDPGRAPRLRSVSTVNGEFFIPALPGQIPSAEGYFGAYGGKFIPEALVAAVGRGRRRVREGQGRSRVRRAARGTARALRRAPERAHRGTPIRGAGRRRAGVPQARGPEPHRLAQGQQRARTGPADQADGQAAGHRRDRARASTGWPPRPRARCSASNARSTWASSTSVGRRSTWRG